MNNAPPPSPAPGDDNDRQNARSPLDWPSEAGLGPELAGAIRAEVRWRRRVRLGVASATCAVLGALFLWSRGGIFAPPAAPAVVSSLVSRPERRTLSDGSVVELRPDAAIVVNFTPELRRVTLTCGEAHFEVAKNPARPFIVATEGVEVRAVGTAFTVGRDQGAVDVVVTEGRVTVARAASTSASHVEPLPLAAGYHAILPSGAESAPAVTALSPADLAARLAWRVPRLEFSGAPLSEVVRLFAEQGHVRLVIGDAALCNVRISGILRADNTDALLQLLALDHRIEAEPRAGEIVLRQRP